MPGVSFTHMFGIVPVIQQVKVSTQHFGSAAALDTSSQLPSAQTDLRLFSLS